MTKPSHTLDNSTVQNRLLTGVGSKGGSRGSLSRCATKYGSLYAKIVQQGPSSADESMKDELMREVRLFQVEMSKWTIMIQSGQKELSELGRREKQFLEDLSMKEKNVQELREKAILASKNRKYWQEYETLAKLARQRSPRRSIKVKMERLKKDLQKVRSDLEKADAESHLREKQFHLLIQCISDLKRSLDEETEIPPKKQEYQGDEQEQDSKKTASTSSSGGTTKKSDEAEKMDVDKSNDEDGLYSDL